MKVFKRIKNILPVAIIALMVAGCEKKDVNVEVTVKNDLDFNRKEIVSITGRQLNSILKNNRESSIRIKKESTEEYLPIQWIDYDTDGKMDELLFMAEVKAKGSAVYRIVADSTVVLPESKQVAYSRFVPERTDDYTWENDKVAFRTYGPKGQKEALEGVPGSTMSSGIDLWLKRVEYPIINKWYKGYMSDPMYYHKDRGEGYDPYHVGGSRGTGGICIYANDSLYVSQNFTAYKTIASGPLRTVFELSYAPWSPYGVHETKRISLDAGSNFSKFEVSLKSDKAVPNFAIGITTHNNKGDVRIEAQKGWVRNWETIDSTYIGEGIVLNPGQVQKAFAKVSSVPDQSNILVLAKPTDKLVYYAGFAWAKSGQVTMEADWDMMLEKQAQILANPLKVSLSNNK